MVEVGLRAFRYPHLKVYGVTDNVHLSRLNAREHISVVIIKVANSILIIHESLVHEFLVVDITLYHAEEAGQLVGIVNSIADPCDVSQVVLLTLVHLNIYINMLRVVVPDAVLNDISVTVAKLVIFIKQFLLVLLPSGWRELLGLQECG